MMSKLLKLASAGLVSYLAYRRAKDGDFSALRGCRSSMDEAAESAKEGLAKAKASVKKSAAKVASEAKGVCKEV